ncbi:DUF2157 domain-containing protein [Flavobacterium tegetincola]|uniref:DUF2157 domain-containing protein n=1 Tax=Flavobacterium tegetincola TaxID=150172 RepID=UPI000408FB74|nr:DUF2157 domain-containing protein [Flavobacterium tegetincola]
MNKIYDLLHAKNLISKEQHQAIEEYSKLQLFSIRNELLFLLYISILLFTTGVGIIIYKNIDTIGHTILLILLAVATALCLYFCKKKAVGFSKDEVKFENPLYEYLVLFTTILMCTFIGYFQYNLNFQDSNYSVATLVSAVAALGMAYYFDNKSALTIGITALGSFIGLSIQVQTLIDNDNFDDPRILFSGLVFGGLLMLWQFLSDKYAVKTHFSFVILTFALHLLALSCFGGYFQNGFWIIYLAILAAVLYYFYLKSVQFKAISWYSFVLIYGYFGANILLFKVLESIDLDLIYGFIPILSPFYFIGSIILFVKLIRDFKKKINVSE